MPDEDEVPAGAEFAEAAIKKNERKRGRQAGHRHRQHQQLFHEPGPAALPLRQHIGRGHAQQQGRAETGEGHQQREIDGAAVEAPDLADPPQCQAALEPLEEVDGETGHDRQDHRHDEEGADERGDRKLCIEAAGACHAAAATPEPAALRASASTSQVMNPSTKLKLAAMAKLALSVNSV